MPNSIIISGPNNAGKTTLALDISREVNCKNTQNNSSDQTGECQCDQCRRIDSNNHPDVLLINKQSICSNVNEKGSCNNCGPTTKQTVIPICVIRDFVLGKSQTKPFYGTFQITILEDAHLLRRESIDHLLKILEEGTPNFLMILLVKSLDVLPLTIKSRCQSYKLFPLPSKLIEKLLGSHYSNKKDNIDTIAKLSKGCFGKAINIIEHPILLDNQNQTIERILELLKNPLSKQLQYSNELSSLYRKNRESVQNELECWSNWFRDILMIKTNQEKKIIYTKYFNQTNEIASKISLSETLNLLKSISSSKKTLEMNISPLVIFDLLVKQIPKNIKINSN